MNKDTVVMIVKQMLTLVSALVMQNNPTMAEAITKINNGFVEVLDGILTIVLTPTKR